MAKDMTFIILVLTTIGLYQFAHAPKERTDSRFSQHGDGLYLDQAPYTGTALVRYLNGKLSDKLEFVDGKMSGLQRTFHLNGRLIAEQNYLAGKREGLQTTWYPTGERRSVSRYLNGLKEGEAREWHQNGRVRKDQTFEHGVEISDKEFFQTGEIYSNYVRRNDRVYGTLPDLDCPTATTLGADP